MFKKIVSQRILRMIGLAVLALALFGLGALVSRPPQPVTAAPEQPGAVTDYFVCTPTESGVFFNRVALRCATPAPSGVYYFALGNTDSAVASRYLSLFTSGLLAGKNIGIYYDPTKHGDSFGCNFSDCRPLWGAILLP